MCISLLLDSVVSKLDFGSSRYVLGKLEVFARVLYREVGRGRGSGLRSALGSLPCE